MQAEPFLVKCPDIRSVLISGAGVLILDVS